MPNVPVGLHAGVVKSSVTVFARDAVSAPGGFGHPIRIPPSGVGRAATLSVECGSGGDQRGEQKNANSVEFLRQTQNHAFSVSFRSPARHYGPPVAARSKRPRKRCDTVRDATSVTWVAILAPKDFRLPDECALYTSTSIALSLPISWADRT